MARGVGVNQIPVPPQAGGISATEMRQALSNDDDDNFIAGLPRGLKPQDIHDILTLLGEEPLAETSGVGAVAGPAGPFGTPLRRQRRKQRKDEGLVNEVVDYLLGISVG